MKNVALKSLDPLTEPCVTWLGLLGACVHVSVLVALCLGLVLSRALLARPPALRFWRWTRPIFDGTLRSRVNGRLTNALFTALLLVGHNICGQPAQIILFRHAEKPADAASVHLSGQGEERARDLVSLLGRNSALTSNAPVAALYATRITKHDHSHRTGETLGPLSQDLRLPVNTAFDSDNFILLATFVLKNPAYRGKTVIICWTHHDIAQLAAALGVRPEPPAWKNKTFDRLWLIAYASGEAKLRDLAQHLLSNDSVR